MSKHYLLIVLLCIVAFSAKAQDPRFFVSCPIDSSSEFELTLWANLEKGKLTERLEINRILRAPFNPSADSCSRPYLVEYDIASQRFKIITQIIDSIYKTEVANYTWCTHDSILQYLNLDKVKRFHVIYSDYSYYDSSYTKPIDLSQLRSLKHLELPQLEQFGIRFWDHTQPAYVHLSEWPPYASIKNSTTPKELNIYVNSFEKDDLLRDLQAIQGVNTADIQTYSFKANGDFQSTSTRDIHELLKFPDLSILDHYDSGFHHELFNAPSFMGFTQEAIYSMNTAERFLFTNHLPDSGLFFCNYVDSLIYNKLPEINTMNGKLVVLASDLWTFDWDYDPYDLGRYPVKAGKYFNWVHPTDTIVYGELSNGQQVGEWHYFHDDNSTQYATVCTHHSIEKITFPESGAWTYYYPNGSSAVRGNFKHGKKTGTWLFYAPNGMLEEREHYKNDELRGLVTLSGTQPYQENVRTFYSRNKAVIYAAKRPNSNVHYFSAYKNGLPYIYVNGDKELQYYKHGELNKSFSYESKGYQRKVKHLLRKMYPELKRKEVKEMV